MHHDDTRQVWASMARGKPVQRGNCQLRAALKLRLLARVLRDAEASGAANMGLNMARGGNFCPSTDDCETHR